MEKYLVIMQQEQEGCDYTIGCGVAFTTFHAENLEGAREKARDLWFGGEGGYKEFEWQEQELEEPDEVCYIDDETRLENMILCKVVEDCPIGEWEDRVFLLRQQLDEAQIRKAELRKLSELKAKYER